MAREELATDDARPLINRREHEASRAFVEEFCIGRHQSGLVRALETINVDHPTRLDVHQWAFVQRRLAEFAAFHHEYPFVSAPRDVLHVGTTVTLRQFANGAPLSFTPGEMARGLIVIGSSGSGKTVLLLRTADASLATTQEWIIDGKGDAPALAVRHQQLLVFTDDSPVDFLARPPYLSISEHIALLLEPIARTMYVGQTGKAVLHEALTKLFADHEHPTLAQLITTLDGMIRKGDTYDRVNAIRNIALRLRRLIARFPGLTAERAVPLYKLCEKSVLWSFTAYTDVEDMIVTCAVLHLFHHHRAHNLREHTTTIQVDEALLAFRVDNGRHINGNLLAELVGLTREYGIAWRLSVNTVTLLDPGVIANVFAIIALNVNSGSEATAVARTLGFSPAQAEYHARKLTRGQAIVRLGDRWRYPLLCVYDDLPFAKTISPDAWQAVTQRIKDLAAKEGIEATGQLTASHAPAPSSPSPTLAAPVIETTTDTASNTRPRIAPVQARTSPNTIQEILPSNTPRRVALNKHASALLHDVALHPLTLTTPCFQRCRLRLSEGERAKTTVTNLEFLESFKVRTGAGRGKTGQAMRLTPAGWAWLGKKPPKSTKGGDSAQHEFLVVHLSRLIPRSTIETLGADLVIPYNNEEHKQLHQALEALSATTIALNNGDLIALEIECSRPKVTAPRNVTRDAGFALTVIAIFGKQTATFGNRVLVVNVLHLLDALRPTEER